MSTYLVQGLPIDQIVQGHVLDVLGTFPDGCVNCCVTSPPYWGLRDYKLEPIIWGGESGCEHIWIREAPRRKRHAGDIKDQESKQATEKASSPELPFTDTCGVCRAWRGSLGLEPTPDLYVKHLVLVFHEVRRVLRSDGPLWLNMGDTYASSWGSCRQNKIGNPSRTERQIKMGNGLKEKDLVGMPWRVAFALQADGWYLRSDIIWSKSNPMPESVTDRPTKAHEYVFLLSKSPRYYFDQEVVREPSMSKSPTSVGRPQRNTVETHGLGGGNSGINTAKRRAREQGGFTTRNIRSVWTIPTQPFRGAHFATFPERLVEPMIKAGCPAQVCRKCGKSRERIVDNPKIPNVLRNRSEDTKMSFHDRQIGGGQVIQSWRDTHPMKTVGWSDCGCGKGWRPGIALDPFFGSGTVGVVAKKLARHFIGIELSAEYYRMAEERLRPYRGQATLAEVSS